MFNLQPGQNLGFSWMKDIGLGLGGAFDVYMQPLYTYMAKKIQFFYGYGNRIFYYINKIKLFYIAKGV